MFTLSYTVVTMFNISLLTISLIVLQYAHCAQAKYTDDVLDGSLKGLLKSNSLYQLLSKHVKGQTDKSTTNGQKTNSRNMGQPGAPFTPLLNDMQSYPPYGNVNSYSEPDIDGPMLSTHDLLNMINSQGDYNNQPAMDYMNNDDYYPNVDDGFNYAVDGQDAWFDGQVIPKVVPVTSDDDPDGQLNQMLINYLYDRYLEDGDPDGQFSNRHTNVLGKEKRRQKIVIKDNKRDGTNPKSSSTTPTTSTTTTTTTTAAPTPSGETRRMKMLHKSVKLVHRGQKEVPLLRPAEVKQKSDWPSELDENSLSEVSLFFFKKKYQSKT